MDGKIEICTSLDDKLNLFHGAMRNEENILSCNCLPECESTTFETNVASNRLSPKEICDVPEQREMALGHWRKNMYDVVTWRYKQFLENPETLVNRDNDDLELNEKEEEEICKQVIENNLAKLSVVIKSPTAMRAMKSIRVSFTDQLGVIGKREFMTFLHRLTGGFLHLSGGNMGLFSGLSLISLAEVIFWILKTLRALIQKALRV